MLFARPKGPRERQKSMAAVVKCPHLITPVDDVRTANALRSIMTSIWKGLGVV